MEKKLSPKKSTGCGCGHAKTEDVAKTAIDSKRKELIDRILSRRQKENPVYKTRNKLFL